MFGEHIGKFVKKLDMLRPEKDGPAYLGDKPALTWTYPEVKASRSVRRWAIWTVSSMKS